MLPEQSSKSYPESMVGVIADKDMTEVKKEIDKLFEKVKDDRQRQHDFAYGHKGIAHFFDDMSESDAEKFEE